MFGITRNRSKLPDIFTKQELFQHEFQIPIPIKYVISSAPCTKLLVCRNTLTQHVYCIYYVHGHFRIQRQHIMESLVESVEGKTKGASERAQRTAQVQAYTLQ